MNSSKRRASGSMMLMSTPGISQAWLHAQPADFAVPVSRALQTGPRERRRSRACLYEAVRFRLFTAVFGASALVLAACGGGGGSKATSGRPLELAAETASFDLAVGPPARYM